LVGRLFCVVFNVFQILYGGIVVYGPALALSEATGFDMWIAILSTGLVCIFYTTLVSEPWTCGGWR